MAKLLFICIFHFSFLGSYSQDVMVTKAYHYRLMYITADLQKAELESFPVDYKIIVNTREKEIAIINESSSVVNWFTIVSSNFGLTDVSQNLISFNCKDKDQESCVVSIKQLPKSKVSYHMLYDIGGSKDKMMRIYNATIE